MRYAVKDILLQPDGDLLVSDNGDIVITDSVRQAIRIRLRWFFDEWRLGPTFGIPYYEEVFIKKPNENRIRQLVRDEIMSVEEVNDVKDITIKIDNGGRTASILYTAVTAEETFREEMMIIYG